MAKCEECGKEFLFFAHHVNSKIVCEPCFLRVYNANPMVAYHEAIPQWIFPTILLDTPQSAFHFPEYPGLSVAMRLYIVVGKICWWLAVLLNWGSYILTIILGFVDPEFPLRGVFFGIVLLPLMFLIQLLSNLGLAFVFGSCEIVKVLVRNEENTRTVKKLLEKQIQTEDE